MARIFPESPAGVLPAESLRTFIFLKRLPDDWDIWHHLAPWQPNSPDFLLLNTARQALLVKVSTSRPAAASPAAQLLLIEREGPALGEAESKVLSEFCQALFPVESGGNPITTLVLFANIPDKQVQSARLERLPGEAEWSGREILQDGAEEYWQQFFALPPLDERTLERLRHAFTPEVIVPEDLTVRQMPEHILKAGLTGYLLDYDQEAILKNDLNLPTEAEEAVGDFRLNILNGVAGSGKTIILLYRLRLLNDLFPNKEFLIVTHNRPLIQDMEARFYRLTQRLPENIHWHTFYSWCHQHWLPDVPWSNPLSQKERNELNFEVWRQVLKDSRITATQLEGEINWFKDQLPMSRADYLATERRGRGFALAQSGRERMYTAIQEYQKRLEASRQCDWGDVPLKIWLALQDGSLQPPVYDAVMVDEAQFFAPLWMDILRRLVKPRVGHLFIAADPTQGFLKRGESWRSLGLEARGRSHVLRQPYRSTQQILAFANLFFRSRLEENETSLLAVDLMNMPTGVVPELVPLAHAQDEIARVANEAVEFVRRGFPHQHLLILHANWKGANAIMHAINRKLGRDAAMDPKDTYPGNYIRVTTINAGTGLESPVVFLAGLREFFEAEQSARLSDEEREALVEENTRKVYMAMTRAGQRLVVTYSGSLPAGLRLIHPRLPD
jgi:hypothetical protein